MSSAPRPGASGGPVRTAPWTAGAAPRTPPAREPAALAPAPGPRRRSRRPPHERVEASLRQLVQQDGPLDLAGPLPDPVDADLAPQAFHRVLPHVPAPAVDLHGTVQH